MTKWMLLLLFWLPTAQANSVRAVYKVESIIEDTKGLSRFDFGLRSEQVSKIAHLTNGRVNLGNVYYKDVDASSVPALAANPNFSGVIYPNVPPPLKIESSPADPELDKQWWIDSLKVRPAWLKATGKGQIIADCDAGYYHDEPDLLPNMLLEHKRDLSDTSAPDIVNDGPYAFHGTAVAAIMSGVKNGSGTMGIAYDSKVVPLQNFNYDGNKDKLDKEEATAQCILYAITIPDVSIIVLENQTAKGSSETFIGTRDAVRLAMSSGITVVGAAGNYRMELIEEAKDDTGSIIVGALAQNGNSAGFTNFGDRMTVGAYGEKLFTLFGPNGRFAEFGGTSGATPQVAAAVAMMREVNPLLTPEQIRTLLQQTRAINDGNRKAGGQLNIEAAVNAAIAATSDPSKWAEQQMFRAKLQTILLN